MPILDIQAIQDILPHRYPFLLVDRILELSPERAVGVKNVSANEPQFQGHFPGIPIMPGVLLLEAMAQVAGIMVVHTTPAEVRRKQLMLFAGIDGARFRRLVAPGDQVMIETRVLRSKAGVYKVSGRATVEGALVAEAELMCKVVPRSAEAEP
jgi:beta-hydroxyacyl-ACP dehydratase FabZ